MRRPIILIAGVTLRPRSKISSGKVVLETVLDDLRAYAISIGLRMGGIQIKVGTTIFQITIYALDDSEILRSRKKSIGTMDVNTLHLIEYGKIEARALLKQLKGKQKNVKARNVFQARKSGRGKPSGSWNCYGRSAGQNGGNLRLRNHKTILREMV